MFEILSHPNIPNRYMDWRTRVILGAGWGAKERTDAILGKFSLCLLRCSLQDAEFHQWLGLTNTTTSILSTSGDIFSRCRTCMLTISLFILEDCLQCCARVRFRGEVYRIVDRGLDLCFENSVTPYIGLQPLVEHLDINWTSFWEPDFYAPWAIGN